MLTAIKEEIDRNTVIVGDFITSLTLMDGSSRLKINKETQALNDTIEQIDLIDIYGTFHPKTADYIFSTPSPAFVVCRLSDDGHADWCEVIPHCSFDLHFSNN